MTNLTEALPIFHGNLTAKGYHLSDFALFAPGSISINPFDYSPIGQGMTDNDSNQEVWSFDYEVAILAAGEGIALQVQLAIERAIRDFKDAWRSIPGAAGGIVTGNPAGMMGNILTIAISIRDIYV